MNMMNMILSAAVGPGMDGVVDAAVPFQMMNMPVVTSQYWNIVYGRIIGVFVMW